MKIVVVGCTHAGTAAVVNLKELHPESEITIYEKNDNLSFLIFVNEVFNQITRTLFNFQEDFSDIFTNYT